MGEKDFNTLKDERLIELIREQNQFAFSELFDREWSFMFESALKVLKDEALAKDVVQEVFIDLWNKPSELEIHNAKAYLRRSTKYKAIDQIRKKKVTLIDLDFVDDFFKLNNSTEDIIRFNDLKMQLNETVELLPKQCKRIFKMSRFDELSNKEIAEKLNISVRTVENHIAHALKVIRPTICSIMSLVSAHFMS